jgi:hypothetical protein
VSSSQDGQDCDNSIKSLQSQGSEQRFLGNQPDALSRSDTCPLLRTVEDYDDWIKWLGHKGGIGVNANESWESWWAEEQEHLQYTGLWGKLWEVALSLRFFLFQYGVVYQMNVTHGNKAAWVRLQGPIMLAFSFCF